MSIKSNAEIIRDETAANANTATRVGGNLVEIANDLIAKQSAIDLNSAKVGYTEDAVSSNTTVTANAAAILTKLGKSNSSISVNDINVLTAASYAALTTKVATRLYFTT